MSQPNYGRNARSRSLLRGLSKVGLVAISLSLLAGCASTSKSTLQSPSPTTEEVLSAPSDEEIVERFLEYSDPVGLRLAAGSDADAVGRWFFDLDDAWHWAGCETQIEMFELAIEFDLDWDSIEWSRLIAEATSNVFAEAMWGPSWRSVPDAPGYRDAMVGANLERMAYCLLKDQGSVDVPEDTGLTEFVSAIEAPPSDDGSRKVLITEYTVTPSYFGNGFTGQSGFFLHVIEEDGFVVVQAITGE